MRCITLVQDKMFWNCIIWLWGLWFKMHFWKRNFFLKSKWLKHSWGQRFSFQNIHWIISRIFFKIRWSFNLQYVVGFVKIHLFNKFQENQCFSTLFFPYRFHKAWSTATQLLYFVSIQGEYVKSFSMAICSNLPQIYPHSSGGKNSLIHHLLYSLIS